MGTYPREMLQAAKKQSQNGNYEFLYSTNGFLLKFPKSVAGMSSTFFSHSKGTRIGMVSFARSNWDTREDDSQVGEDRDAGPRGRRKAGWLMEVAWLAARCTGK